MSRDTQFKGFAKLLLHDMLEAQGVNIDEYDDDWEEVWEEVIARRAYDLVVHTLYHAPMTEWTCGPSDIPDITEVIDEQQ